MELLPGPDFHAARSIGPARLNKAEYWDVNPYVVKAPQEGAGFDTTLTDGLRIAIRDVHQQRQRAG